MKLRMEFLVFFLMLPHLKPDGLAYLWPTVATAFNMGQKLSIVVIIFLYILKKRLPSMSVWVLVLFQCWISIASYLNGQGLRSILISFSRFVSIAMLIDFFSKSPSALLKGLLLNMEILIYPNLISVLLFFPNGQYRSTTTSSPGYFLGHRNQFITFILPAIVISLLYIRQIGRKIRPILLIIVSCIQVIFVWSATSICGIFVFALLLILSKSFLSKWITFPTIFASTMVINLLISVFRVMDRVSLISSFIESILKKEITLTGRTFLWDSVYLRFFASPWIGYGRYAESVVGTHLAAHNQWFQFLLEGGIPGLTLFLLFNFVIGKQLMRCSETQNIYFFCAMLCAMYTIFITDVYLSSPWFYMLYILAYHADKFEAVPAVHRKKIRLLMRGYHVPNRKLSEKH